MPRLMVPGIFTDEQKEKMKKISFNLINVRAVGSGDVEYINWMYDIFSDKMTEKVPKNNLVRAKISAFLKSVKNDYGKNTNASDEEKKLITEMTDKLWKYTIEYGELEDIFRGKYQYIESNHVKDILYGFRGEENPDKDREIKKNENNEIIDRDGNIIENIDDYFADYAYNQPDLDLTVVEDVFSDMNAQIDSKVQEENERLVAVEELKMERDNLKRACEKARRVLAENPEILDREQWVLPGEDDFADPTEDEINARIRRNREQKKNEPEVKREPEMEKCAEGLLKVLDQFNRITGYRYTGRPEIKALETMGGNVEKAVMKLEGFKIDEDEKTIIMQNDEMLEAFRKVSEYNREMLNLLTEFNKATGIEINNASDFGEYFKNAEKEQNEFKMKADEFRREEADAEKELEERRKKLSECGKAEEESIAEIQNIVEIIKAGSSKKEQLLKEINEATAEIADIKTKRQEYGERFKKDSESVYLKIHDLENKYGIYELLQYEAIYNESEKIGKMIKDCNNDSPLFWEKDLENIRKIHKNISEWNGKDCFRFNEIDAGETISYMKFFENFDDACTALYGNDGHETARSRLYKMTKAGLKKAEEENRVHMERGKRKNLKEFFLPELIGLYDEMKARIMGKEHDIKNYLELKEQHSKLNTENSDRLTSFREELDEAEERYSNTALLHTSRMTNLEETAMEYARKLEQEKKLLNEKKEATENARKEYDKAIGRKTAIIANARKLAEDNKPVMDRYRLVKESMEKYDRLCAKRDGISDILKKARANNNRPKTECDTRFERITEKLKDFTDHIEDGRGNHRNTVEFTEMAKALEAFSKAATRFAESNKDNLDKPGKAVKVADDKEFLGTLANLRKKTQEYITKKGSQFVIESWTSKLRHTRLNFARRLYVWTDNLNENLGKTLKTEFSDEYRKLINNAELATVVEADWNSVRKYEESLKKNREQLLRILPQKSVDAERKENIQDKKAQVVEKTINGPVMH